MIIRRAGPEDMEEIMPLVCSVFEEQGIPRELDFIPEDRSPLWWCAEAGKTVIGAIASYKEDGKTHLGRFAIRPGYRGRGIGTRLLRCAVEDVFAHGVQRIYTESRPVTVAILEKMGAKISGETFPFYQGVCTPVDICKEDYIPDGTGGTSMKKILVVIDMQNDFISGSLGTPEAEKIVEAVKAKILSYPAEAVLATMDTHGPDYLSTQEGRMLPVEHCIRGTEGWNIHPGIAALLTEAAIFEKPTFGSVQLAEAVSRMKDVEEIEFIGLCTDICVVSNALMMKAYLPEVRILVDARCCAGVTEEKHRAALETMRSCQIEIIE